MSSGWLPALSTTGPAQEAPAPSGSVVLVRYTMPPALLLYQDSRARELEVHALQLQPSPGLDDDERRVRREHALYERPRLRAADGEGAYVQLAPGFDDDRACYLDGELPGIVAQFLVRLKL